MANKQRLIDANALVETIHDTADGLADCDQQNAAWALRKYAVRDIMETHTVDAVEVVRCKDCIHWDSETGWCNNHSAFDDHDMDWNIYNDDDFCSCGERRTDCFNET